MYVAGRLAYNELLPVKVAAKGFRFGPNEIDLRSYELRRAGRCLPISKIPLNLLILLVERRGTLVTREEIAAHLWSHPEMVDHEHGIHNAINRIRGLLNDDPQRPRYVETAVGRGYRFIGAVEEIVEPEAAEAVESSDRLRLAQDKPPIDAQTQVPQLFYPAGPRRARWFGIAALSLLVVSVGAWFLRRMTLDVPLQLKATQITSNESENRVTAGAISSSGKLVVYADADGLSLRVIKTGTTQFLKSPAALRVDRIAWFPDDLHLMLSGFNTQVLRFQLWTASIAGGDPNLIRENARNGMPSPDGSRLAFTANNESEIWISGVSGERMKLFLKGRPGEDFPFVFWGNGGKRLSYQRREYAPGSTGDQSRSFDANFIWDYGSRDFASGKELAFAKNIRFDSACVTAGGRMFYLRTEPPKDAQQHGIWEVQTDQATGAFSSAPRQLTFLADEKAYGITASNDGKQIAAVWERGQPDVYIADLHHQPGPILANVRRLTSDSRSDFPHAWSSDSQSVIFESNREGDYHLFHRRLNSRTTEQLTEMQGQQIYPQLSPDGSTVLFALLPGRLLSSNDSLYRVSVDGGTPVEIPLDRPLDEFRCPLPGAGSCVLRETLDHRQYVYYALDPVKGKGREAARTSWVPNVFGDWAVSPDGNTVALPLHKPGPKIRLVPLNASLDAAGSPRRETEIDLRGIDGLWGLTWAADGKGWFAEAQRAGASLLVYIDTAGRIDLLRETTHNTWGIPSPDGGKLAFVDYTADRNVWLWQ